MARMEDTTPIAARRPANLWTPQARDEMFRRREAGEAWEQICLVSYSISPLALALRLDGYLVGLGFSCLNPSILYRIDFEFRKTCSCLLQHF